MLLVEYYLIKKNHSLFAEGDGLSFLTKNLYNAANYLDCQNFFTGQKRMLLLFIIRSKIVIY